MRFDEPMRDWPTEYSYSEEAIHLKFHLDPLNHNTTKKALPDLAEQIETPNQVGRRNAFHWVATTENCREAGEDLLYDFGYPYRILTPRRNQSI